MSFAIHKIPIDSALVNQRKAHSFVRRKCQRGNQVKMNAGCESFEKESVAGIQPKLKVGAEFDQYEEEADRVSKAVMHGSNNHLTQIVNPLGSPTPLSKKKVINSANVSHQVISNVVGSSGSKIDGVTLQFMEQRFGQDFSDVRIHTGQRADKSARSVNARAYTFGADIVMANNEYNPSSYVGRKLLAHELTHTIQQSQAGRSKIQRLGGTSVHQVDGGLSREMLLQIVRRLNEAIDGFGTDEEAIFAVLAGRTQTQINAIARVYQEENEGNIGLMDALVDELSESELNTLALAAPEQAGHIGDASAVLATGRYDMIARQLYSAVYYIWGTDETAIFAALSGRTGQELIGIKAAYQRLDARGLEDALRDELSGGDLRMAHNLLDQADENMPLDFDLCTSGQRKEIRGYWPIAKNHVARAINSLVLGWSRMTPVDKSLFRKYFDPSNSNTINETFVAQVRENFLHIQNYMQSLTFNCDVDDGSICGDGNSLCQGARLYWTCFGDIRVCPYFSIETNNRRKMSDIIHESTHNALRTTDRAYYGQSSFNQLSPYGSGPLSFAQKIPVLGYGFRLFTSNNDTLNNPDSYSHYARDV